MIEAFKLLGKIALDGADKVQHKLDKLDKKVQETSQKMREFGDNVKATGEGLATSLTVPLALFGGMALKSASDLSKGTSTIQQELGVTGAEAEKLNGVAKKLWAQGFGEDLEGVATKVAQVTKSLGDLGESDLSYVTEGLDLLERRGWADTQESLRAVKTLMQNFGMSSQEAMDYLTAGFQNNLDYSGEFLDSISEYSTYFNEMGFSGNEMFNVLKSGAEGGAFQLDKVGDAVKEFSLRAKANSELTQTAFSDLGLSSGQMIKDFNKGGEAGRKAFTKTIEALQNVENETERNRIATDLFGTQYEDLGEVAFETMLKASKSMENIEGATQRANESFQETFGTRLQSALRQAQIGLEPVGQVLMDFVERILPPLLKGIQGVATWFGNLSPMGQNMVVMFGGLLAIIPPFLIFLGAMANAFSVILPWITKILKLFKYLRMALVFLTGPIGIVIGVIGLLIAVGIQVYKNWDKISKFLVNTWKTIVQNAKKLWASLTQAIQLAITLLGKIITNKFNRDKALILAIWNGIKSALTNVWNNIKTAVTSKVGEISNNVRSRFSAIKSAIINPILEAKNKVLGFVDAIVRKFRNIRLTIPKPKVPKFSLKMGTKKIFDKTFTFPTGFDVSWNAKGGIVDGATLIGAGERGKEMIMPLEGKYFKPVASMIAEQMEHLNLMGGPKTATIEIPIILNGREMARALVTDMDKEIQRQSTIRKRGV